MNINDLPIEILRDNILRYANRDDILNVRLVNRRWRDESVPAYRMQIYSRNPDLNANKITHIENPNIALTSEDILSCIRYCNREVRNALMEHRRQELDKYDLHGDLRGYELRDGIAAENQRNQERFHRFILRRRGFIG